MFNDSVVKLIQPGILTDRLTEVLRDGARALFTQAVEAEVSEFLAATAYLKTDGCQRIVRHGHLPERQIMTGIGPVAVRQPRVRDREAGADDPAHPLHACNPSLRPAFEEPRYADPDPLSERRIDQRLRAGAGRLARQGCSCLSATTIARLKRSGPTNTSDGASATCRPRATSTSADGVYLQARLEEEAQCILVIIGATPEGNKELLGFVYGAEAPTTLALLLDISSAGVCRCPEICVADGATGFWKTIGELCPRPVSNDAGCIRPPTSSQTAQEPAARPRMLQDVWMAETEDARSRLRPGRTRGPNA